MENNEEFEQAIQTFSDEIKEIVRQTRKLIYKVLPEVVEVAWIRQKNTRFGTGPNKKTEHFCWVMPSTNHVKLGFNYGAELPDPKKLLEGTSVKELSNADLIKLLKYSTTYRVPPINQENEQNI